MAPQIILKKTGDNKKSEVKLLRIFFAMMSLLFFLKLIFQNNIIYFLELIKPSNCFIFNASISSIRFALELSILFAFLAVTFVGGLVNNKLSPNKWLKNKGDLPGLVVSKFADVWQERQFTKLLLLILCMSF